MMLTLPPKYRFSTITAVIFHAVLIAVLIYEVSTTSYRTSQIVHAASVETIQAVAVSQSQVQSQVQKILQEKATAQRIEQLRIEKLEAQALAIKQAHIVEQKKLAHLKAQHQAELRKIAREKQAKAHALALKKQQEKQQKLLLTAKQKKLQELLIQQQLQNEQNDLNKMQSRIQQGEIDRYKAHILSVIQSNWRIAEVNNQLQCIYTVNIGPGGVVLSVNLMKSSGDGALDQSAREAIFKSSPLPVPKDVALFDHFRQLVLTLSPKGYL